MQKSTPQTTLQGQKIAFLVANGFREQDLVETQRHLQRAGADTKIVSMDAGLVGSLNESGWGLNFAVDQTLNTSLAADFAGIIIPGGDKSIQKLQLTAHTRRFVRGFYDMRKPVCFVRDALDLLAFCEIETELGGAEALDVHGNLASLGSVESIGQSGLNEFILDILLEEEAVAA